MIILLWLSHTTMLACLYIHESLHGKEEEKGDRKVKWSIECIIAKLQTLMFIYT